MSLNIYHPLCTTKEFALVIRHAPEVVMRMIRTHRITAAGRPYRIHIREAEKFGLGRDDVRELLKMIRTQAEAASVSVE